MKAERHIFEQNEKNSSNYLWFRIFFSIFAAPNINVLSKQIKEHVTSLSDYRKKKNGGKQRIAL
jgi:hypothetical protein